ncbi:MAG: metallophosphoesterase [Clostridiales bacterium]|jgi:hypothetical protein|nr:metallophosphoesterase [Clostridiales bacterium]
MSKNKLAASLAILMLISVFALFGCGQNIQDKNPPGGEKNGNDDEIVSVEEDKKSAVLDIPDFIVSVETGRDPVILQLTDTQIIDAAQARSANRLTGMEEYWATDKIEDRCYGYLRETIETIEPDLIILTGDIVYGEFDDSGTALTGFIQFMDSFEVPWAPVFGNHENESEKGADWQSQQLENGEYCLFKQRTLTGNGNYSVGIEQGGALKRVFYMLDSNGCGAASAASIANGHTKNTAGFGADQIRWYTNEILTVKALSPETKISFAYHIQQAIFKVAFAKYGFTNVDTINNPINIDRLENRAEGDFGYIGRDLKGPWDSVYTVWNGMKTLGVDSVFVGHEHCNSASVVHEGVRFQFGQKSSTYDRANFVNMADGTITGSYPEIGTPLVGGTYFLLSETDGTLIDANIYLCKNAGGEIDWDQWQEVEDAEDVEVGGLQKGTDLTHETTLTVAAVRFQGVNAYEVIAKDQGKVFVAPALLVGKSTFIFSIYVVNTQERPANKLAGYGEFIIRVKPNNNEPPMDKNPTDGHIGYNSSSENDNLRVIPNEWRTFTVDISQMPEECTELSFIIPKGNVVYLKDLQLV